MKSGSGDGGRGGGEGERGYSVVGHVELQVGRVVRDGRLLGGCLAGLGGAVLSVDYTQTWANEITKGRGLIAVGLVIVARWNPRLVIPVCLLFGLAETAALRLPAMGVELSSYVLSALPYAVVLVALVANHIAIRTGTAMPADLKKVFD